MDKYMMIFRNTPVSEDAYANMSPEQMQAEIEKWNSWIGGIAAQGKLIGSDALEATGKIVTGSKKVVTDGPYVDIKEAIGGYIIVKANTLDEAAILADGCPILHVGGTVEVRMIVPMEDNNS